MVFSYRFTKIKAPSGDAFTFLKSGVTCIVGANNSGKSQLLKDLAKYAEDGDQARLVALSSVTHSATSGTTDQAVKLLNQQAVKQEDSHNPELYTLLPSGNSFDVKTFTHQLRTMQQNGGLGFLREAFLRLIPAGALSSFVTGELRTDWSPEQQNNWLLKVLYSDGELERELSQLVSRFFAVPLFMNKQEFPPRLRAGKVKVPAPAVDSVTKEYSQAVADVPTLDEQGDGMRSFAGLALVVLALSPEILLLDEPESFLHPGQARAVGRWLSNTSKERNMQVVVATHDKDFLVGLLDSGGAPAVNVLRVTRSSSGSELRTISSEKLDAYWADPVMKYSNALQGLFHARVVVCEGDADCRFYSAALEELAISRKLRHISDDTLFVSSNGKNGAAKIIGMIADLGVHASVISDFDVLDDKDTLQSIIHKLGYSWSAELDEAYIAMTKHVSKTPQTFWRRAKNGGLSNIPRGDGTRAFNRVINLLSECRLYIVEGGELEDFHREEGKGPAWIGAALAANAHKSEPAINLLKAVVPELK